MQHGTKSGNGETKTCSVWGFVSNGCINGYGKTDTCNSINIWLSVWTSFSQKTFEIVRRPSPFTRNTKAPHEIRTCWLPLRFASYAEHACDYCTTNGINTRRPWHIQLNKIMQLVSGELSTLYNVLCADLMSGGHIAVASVELHHCFFHIFFHLK